MLQQMKERQRGFALPKVLPNRFPQRFAVRNVIQSVVGNLERDTKVLAKTEQGLLLGLSGVG
jgi:hypothetical protein